MSTIQYEFVGVNTLGLAGAINRLRESAAFRQLQDDAATQYNINKITIIMGPNINPWANERQAIRNPAVSGNSASDPNHFYIYLDTTSVSLRPTSEGAKALNVEQLIAHEIAHIKYPAGPVLGVETPRSLADENSTVALTDLISSQLGYQVQQTGRPTLVQSADALCTTYNPLGNGPYLKFADGSAARVGIGEVDGLPPWQQTIFGIKRLEVSGDTASQQGTAEETYSEEYGVSDGWQIEISPSSTEVDSLSGGLAENDVLATYLEDGEIVNSYWDVRDDQAWWLQTVQIGNNQEFSIDHSFFDTTDIWTASHFLPANLNLFDEFAAQVFVADLASLAFHGEAFYESVPNALSYEPIFGAGYDFGIGAFDIDYSEFATTVGFDSYNFGFDASAYDYWDDWIYETAGGAFETASFDDWSWGDWYWPIVLDLNNDGVDITSKLDSVVYFDIDGDGAREQTAWAGPQDGFLVIDLAPGGGAGADGAIDQAKEIAFAEWTTEESDLDAEALAVVFDTNMDGVFNASDARWGEFRVWKDADQDGTVDAGELTTLAANGITAIDLALDDKAFLLADGSRINGFGSFTMGGVEQTFADAALAFDEVGFTRIEQSYGFDYVAEDSTVRKYIDTRVFGGYLASTSTVLLNYGGGGGIVADGYFAGVGNDEIYAYGGKAVVIDGHTGNDYLYGDSGNDVLVGGAGRDTLVGDAGDDILFFDSDDFETGVGRLIYGLAGYDIAVLTSTGGMNIALSEDNVEAFVGNEGNDTVSAVDVHLGPSNSDPGALTGSYVDGRGGNDSLTGSVMDDVLVGGTGNDSIAGGGGTDLLMGGSGLDTLRGGDGNDVAFAGDAEDSVEGGAGHDALHGGDGNDSIAGDDGDDTLTGGAGADTVLGGLGSDTVSGGDGGDQLSGGDGDDTIAGDAGNDTISGGAGTDTADYDTATAGVTVSLATASAQNTVGAGTDTLGEIENLSGSAFADKLTGDGGSNKLLGKDGDDTLVGGVGDDTLEGGRGDDTADYSQIAAAIFVSLALAAAQNTVGAGTDTLVDIEHLIGTTSADVLIGNDLANMLDGRGGNDTLVGGAGNDTLTGGSHSDTADYSTSTSAVTVNLSVTTAQDTGGAGIDTLSSIESVIGSAYSDVLTGGSSANTIVGGEGDDTMAGGAGGDWLLGNLGNDSIAGEDNADLIEGHEGNDTLSGDAGNDTVFGGDGDDLVSGGTSHDSLDGGAGNDTVVADQGDDTLAGGSGIDTADYSGFGGAVIVNLQNAAAQDTNAAGIDMLSGFENAVGGVGNDHFTGSTGANLIRGQDGADVLVGIGGNDTLEGGNGNDNIQGGNGDDVLIGGAGREVMVGGGGNDIFRFLSVTDTAVGGQRDKINDFTTGNDLVDLAAVDADANASGDQAFGFIGSAAFSGLAGQLRQYQVTSSGVTIVEGDVNGDGATDFQIQFQGLLTLTAADFVL
jgi:Ca2+-binding RTX toxin-like protein